MIDPDEIRRLREILAKEAQHCVSVEDKRELRELVGRHSDRAWDLPWYGLVEGAEYAVAINDHAVE